MTTEEHALTSAEKQLLALVAELETSGIARMRTRSPKRQAQLDKKRAALRAEIDSLVSPPPFATADNGVHVYLETDAYIVMRNHGCPFWSGMTFDRKGHPRVVALETKTNDDGSVRSLVVGSLDAAEVLAQTIAAAEVRS